MIGRSAACHVSIEDPLVSRQHARVSIDGDSATIEDLGSRNGLLIGGRPIQSRIAAATTASPIAMSQ